MNGLGISVAAGAPGGDEVEVRTITWSPPSVAPRSGSGTGTDRRGRPPHRTPSSRIRLTEAPRDAHSVSSTPVRALNSAIISSHTGMSPAQVPPERLVAAAP